MKLASCNIFQHLNNQQSQFQILILIIVARSFAKQPFFWNNKRPTTLSYIKINCDFTSFIAQTEGGKKKHGKNHLNIVFHLQNLFHQKEGKTTPAAIALGVTRPGDNGAPTVTTHPSPTGEATRHLRRRSRESSRPPRLGKMKGILFVHWKGTWGWSVRNIYLHFHIMFGKWKLRGLGFRVDVLILE